MVGPTRRGKGTKVMLLTDGHGVPLGIDTESASRSECKLIERLLNRAVVKDAIPERLIYDRAADSDKLRDALEARGVELICPHRKGRKRRKRQDGRALRRYVRRWKVERTIAWLHNFRRVITKWERYAYLYHGFVQLACLLIILKRF